MHSRLPSLLPVVGLVTSQVFAAATMGNSPSSPVADCLNAVCNGRTGCVNFPSDPFYQVGWVKPYNLDVPVTPIAVIRPNTAEEVSGAVKCAGQHDLKVQAKSGGHSYANFGLGGEDGELMIDLQNFKSFKMDESNWQATFGSGYRLGDLDKKLHDNGKRAMAHGTCPGVGIGGHATIGGLGPMSRMWANALDHILEVEVVTADGKIQRASEKENSDLFWALRGAGGSFGVITEFVIKTHPEPGNVVQYTYTISLGSQSEMAPIYQQWQDIVADPNLDKRFSTLLIANPTGVLITGTFYGTQEEYNESGIQKKLPAGGKLDLKLYDWLGSLAHIAEVTGLYLSEIPTHFASKSLAFREEDMLSKDSISDLFNYMNDADKGTLLWFIIFNSEGGAVNEVPVDSTAYPHRDKLMMYQSYAVGIPDLSDKTFDFVAGVHDRIRKGAPDANTAYAGYIDIDLDREAAQKFYWGDKVPQLQKVKAAWDPKDMFHNPQSVDPAKE